MKYFIYDNKEIKEVKTKEEYDKWSDKGTVVIYPEIELKFKDVTYHVSGYFDGQYNEATGEKFMPFRHHVSETYNFTDAQLEEMKTPKGDEFWSDGEDFVTPYSTLEELKNKWQETVTNILQNGDSWPKLARLN